MIKEESARLNRAVSERGRSDSPHAKSDNRRTGIQHDPFGGRICDVNNVMDFKNSRHSLIEEYSERYPATRRII